MGWVSEICSARFVFPFWSRVKSRNVNIYEEGIRATNHRLSRLRDDLTDEFGFGPKLADGIRGAATETVRNVLFVVD